MNRRSFIGAAVAALASLFSVRTAKASGELLPGWFWRSSTNRYERIRRLHMPYDWANSDLPGALLFERSTGKEITGMVQRCNPETGYYESIVPGSMGQAFCGADGEIVTEIKQAVGGIDIQWLA